MWSGSLQCTIHKVENIWILKQKETKQLNSVKFWLYSPMKYFSNWIVLVSDTMHILPILTYWQYHMISLVFTNCCSFESSLFIMADDVGGHGARAIVPFLWSCPFRFRAPVLYVHQNAVFALHFVCFTFMINIFLQ